jgi:hypothetical protein
MVNQCPNYWSPGAIFKHFRDMILATWTTEEIISVQRITEAAMLDWPPAEVCQVHGMKPLYMTAMVPVDHG